MIADRRVHPRDDLISMLVHGEVDGDRLDDDEIVFETLLLLIGGDETTRNVTCGGVEVLLAHPDQWRRMGDAPDLLAGAVEEALRWVSPIKSMQRTVTRPVELVGRRLAEGDRVLLLDESANFDEAQFDDPDRFDVARTPNDHIAFGFGARLLPRRAPRPTRAPHRVRTDAGAPPGAPARGRRTTTAGIHRHLGDAGALPPHPPPGLLTRRFTRARAGGSGAVGG